MPNKMAKTDCCMKFKNIVISVALLSLPIILSLGSLHSRELVITHFTSSLGAVDIAAYSVGYVLFNLVLSFNSGFSMGLGVVATRKMGRKDYGGVAETMVNGYLIGLVLATILGIAIFNTDLILKSINESPQLTLLASQFTSMLAFATLPVMIAVASQQFALMVDRPKFIFIFGLITVILIIFFSYVLGMGHLGSPRMGMRGFGLSVLIGASFECFCWILLISYHPLFQDFPIRKKLLSIKFSVINDILRTSLPLGVKQIIGINGVVWAFTLLLGKIGTIDLVVFQLLLSFATISSAISDGVSRVMAINVGKQLGALRIVVARQYTNAGFLIAFAVTALIGLIMIFAPNQLVGLLLTPINPEEHQIFQIAVTLLRFSSILVLGSALMMVSYSILAGFKDTLFTLIAEVGCMWGIALPVSYFLNAFFHGGVRDYLFGLTIGIAVCLAIYIFRIRYQFKKSSESPKRLLDHYSGSIKTKRAL